MAPASESVSSASAAGKGPVQGPAKGSDPAQAEALATELSHDLMSPYCPGRTIATCPSPQARKLESHILEQAQQGKSRVEIEAALAERFPDIRGYIGRPEIIYGTALLALIAIVGLVLVGRRWVRQTRARAAVGSVGAVVGASGALSTDLPAPGGPGAAGKPSRSEVDALDDALDRIDEF
ncbi:cytochrome c-type biogenesis protein CcmH [Nannocystis sp.]|uniref:cytochrome c-type biogenesis protein n=1 Tax=Nannocystis sp. TaxID=1962667 RepID=UPI0024229434|nr:cytochrome c-type biogenesis protein CcmH [Nannocystis sp.]MBK7826753.1 cytochrome c-type biogenesis protein CcmH [Nannocystis sp.]MBK9754372.1 cytochrome c-type biogenesis protein CcmH [Nannocystis sp.]